MITKPGWTLVLAMPYLDIRRVSLAVLPGLRDGVEDAVGVIKLASLQVEEHGREWLLKWEIWFKPVEFE